MSVFKDFPGLKNLEKKFKDFQGPARALDTRNLRKFLVQDFCACNAVYHPYYAAVDTSYLSGGI